MLLQTRRLQRLIQVGDDVVNMFNPDTEANGFRSHSSHVLFLRRHLPMNIRSSFPGREVSPEAQADINRVMAIWRQCRNRYGEGNGDFLFGRFTIADAMYAPVVTRFRTYKIDLEREADAYCDAMTALPAMQEWAAAARNEPMVIDQYEF